MPKVVLYSREHDSDLLNDVTLDDVTKYIRSRIIESFETAFLSEIERIHYYTRKNREACFGKGFKL